MELGGPDYAKVSYKFAHDMRIQYENLLRSYCIAFLLVHSNDVIGRQVLAALVKVAKVTDTEGNEIGGVTGKGAGYKYFGAAKQLPGVRELFEKEAPRQGFH